MTLAERGDSGIPMTFLHMLRDHGIGARSRTPRAARKRTASLSPSPIAQTAREVKSPGDVGRSPAALGVSFPQRLVLGQGAAEGGKGCLGRSEEHTSELQ